MTPVLVLGGSGMLGSMLVDTLAALPGFDVAVTTRSGRPARKAASDLAHFAFDAESGDPSALLENVREGAWIINAIGTIKPFIDESSPASRLRAIRVNGSFPHQLATAAESHSMRVIQIATDCVYSGATGRYDEHAAHDALDIYGKTKSLGEAPSSAVMHLRSSIIGPEISNHLSLLDWFRGLPEGAAVTGFDNHYWNGVTTLHFAKLVAGVISAKTFAPGVFHVEPADIVTKATLLQLFRESFDRHDVVIETAPARQAIDRTLRTVHANENAQRWSDAGYESLPSVGTMVSELAAVGFTWE